MKIKSSEPGGTRSLIIRSARDPEHLVINDWVRVPRADFIAAVETECDGIFIPRGELPAVEARPNGTATVGHLDFSLRSQSWAEARGRSGERLAMHRARALDHIAAAEYLDAHPADHPNQDDLAQMIADYVRPGAVVGSGERKEANAGDLARHLLATGRIEVKP